MHDYYINKKAPDKPRLSFYRCAVFRSLSKSISLITASIVTKVGKYYSLFAGLIF
nr:MAG TPA: hypothetical protein [Caudoviricetes sp.]